MWGSDFQFNFPYAVFMFIGLLPILYGRWALTHYRKRQQHAYAPTSILRQLLVPRSPFFTRLKDMGWLIIWGLACLALMGPIGNIRYASLSPSSSASVQSHVAPHEVIFLVDTSASMLVPDGPQKESRLEESKAILEDIARQLQGQTVSLYAFTSELTSVVPPTLDYLFLRLAMKELHIDEGDVGGTNLASILIALQQQAFPQPSSKRYTLILLSDGGDTQWEQAKDQAKKQVEQAILKAIPPTQDFHLRLFTIGMGSLTPQAIPHVTFEGKPVLSALEPTLLEKLAAEGNGLYYMSQKWTSWELAEELITQMSKQTENGTPLSEAERQVANVNREDILSDLYYQIPLGIVLLLYMFNLLLPDVRRL